MDQSDPLTKYRTFHTNQTNIHIHQICVPLLVVSASAILPIYTSIALNIGYSLIYLLFDIGTKRSIMSVCYIKCLFIIHVLFRMFLSTNQNIIIHIISWGLQIFGHRWFEGNNPALLDSLLDSLVFAPYFTFLETFYPKTLSMPPARDKYTIMSESFDNSKKTIIYFAGLFQKANIEYKKFPNQLPGFNHIYVNVNFAKNDIYEHTVRNIIKKLTENGKLDVECIVGFSFGGSMALQFRDIYCKETKCILISPGGFHSNTMTEKFIQTVGSYLYPLYLNDKWYMINNYPLYQNSHTLCENDYLICSSGDTVHNPSLGANHKNTITLPNISHMKMIHVVYEQQLLPHILNNTYVIEKRRKKSVRNNIVRFIFGPHFNAQICVWCGLSMSSLFQLLHDDVSCAQLFRGFIYIGWIWSTIEYIFHASILHILLYAHHKAHHTYPNKRSTIHVPMVANLGIWAIAWLTNYLSTGSCVASHGYNMFSLWFPLYYLLFEFTHLLSHEYRGTNPVIKNAKYYHKLHHMNETTNFSFVTPFWDYMFGTLSPSYEISFIDLMLGPFPFYSFALRKYTTSCH